MTYAHSATATSVTQVIPSSPSSRMVPAYFHTASDMSSSEAENSRSSETNLACFFGLMQFEPSALELIPPTPPSPTDTASLNSVSPPSALRRPSIGTVDVAANHSPGRRRRVPGSPPLRVSFADEIEGGNIATHWEIPSLTSDEDGTVPARRRRRPSPGVARPDLSFTTLWRLLSWFQHSPADEAISVASTRKSSRTKSGSRRMDARSNQTSRNHAKEKETRGIIVLLLSPTAKQFELVNIYFDGSETTQLSRVLELVPKSATYATLRKQRYVGFCRPLADSSHGTPRNDVGAGRELVNSLTLQEHGVRPNDVLIAIPQGFRGPTCAKLAKPILNDPKMIRLVQRLKQKHKGLPEYALSSRQTSSRHIRRTLCSRKSSAETAYQMPRRRDRVVLLLVTSAVYVVMLSLAVAKAVLPSHKLYALGFFMEDAKTELTSYWAVATVRGRALVASAAAAFPLRLLPWKSWSDTVNLGPSEEVVLECNARFGTQTIGCFQWAVSEASLMVEDTRVHPSPHR